VVYKIINQETEAYRGSGTQERSNCHWRQFSNIGAAIAIELGRGCECSRELSAPRHRSYSGGEIEKVKGLAVAPMSRCNDAIKMVQQVQEEFGRLISLSATRSLGME
jgi:hypothetical protein